MNMRMTVKGRNSPGRTFKKIIFVQIHLTGNKHYSGDRYIIT